MVTKMCFYVAFSTFFLIQIYSYSEFHTELTMQFWQVSHQYNEGTQIFHERHRKNLTDTFKGFGKSEFLHFTEKKKGPNKQL